MRAADRPQLAGLPGASVVDTLLTPPSERHLTVLESVVAPGGVGRRRSCTRCASETEVCFVVEGADRARRRGRADPRSGRATPSRSAPACRTPGATPTRRRGARVLWILAPALPDPQRVRLMSVAVITGAGVGHRRGLRTRAGRQPATRSPASTCARPPASSCRWSPTSRTPPLVDAAIADGGASGSGRSTRSSRPPASTSGSTCSSWTNRQVRTDAGRARRRHRQRLPQRRAADARARRRRDLHDRLGARALRRRRRRPLRRRARAPSTRSRRPSAASSPVVACASTASPQGRPTRR